MELNEAIANVSVLRNLFKGLEKVEETLRVAQTADNVAGERQKLIDDKTAELASIAAGVDFAKAAEATRALEAEKAHTLRLGEQQSQFDTIALSFGSVQARLQAELDAVTEKHASETTKLLDEIRELTQTRDAIQQSTDTLQAQLAQLKDRAASL